MFKKIFLFLSLFFLSNCVTSPTALLGPIFTGAKTGSVYQASISYSTNKIMNEFIEFDIAQTFNNKNSKDFNISTFARNPVIINAHEIEKVEFVEIVEEEPLP